VQSFLVAEKEEQKNIIANEEGKEKASTVGRKSGQSKRSSSRCFENLEINKMEAQMIST